MMRPALYVLALLFALVSAGAAYKVNYDVRALQTGVAELESQIAREEQAIEVLRVHWAWLNAPARLAALVEENRAALDLGPMSPAHFAEVIMVDFPPNPEPEPTMPPMGAIPAPDEGAPFAGPDLLYAMGPAGRLADAAAAAVVPVAAAAGEGPGADSSLAHLAETAAPARAALPMETAPRLRPAQLGGAAPAFAAAALIAPEAAAAALSGPASAAPQDGARNAARAEDAAAAAHLALDAGAGLNLELAERHETALSDAGTEKSAADPIILAVAAGEAEAAASGAAPRILAMSARLPAPRPSRSGRAAE